AEAAARRGDDRARDRRAHRPPPRLRAGQPPPGHEPSAGAARGERRAMSDDYLFDRSGVVDPEVERLETLLEEFRYRQPGLRLPTTLPRPRRVRARPGAVAGPAAAPPGPRPAPRAGGRRARPPPPPPPPPAAADPPPAPAG